MSGAGTTAPGGTFTLSSRFLILCEGKADREFFRAIMTRAGVPRYQVVDPVVLGSDTGGYTKWQESIDAIVTATNSHTLLGLIVVGDNDFCAKDRRDSIIKAIRNSVPFPRGGTKLPIPTRPYNRVDGPPAVAFMMIPNFGVRGNLETLLLKAARTRAIAAEKKSVERFKRDVDWKRSKSSKAEVRTYMLRHWRRDPELPVHKFWERPIALFPINDPAFDHIAQFLIDFRVGI